LITRKIALFSVIACLALVPAFLAASPISTLTAPLPAAFQSYIPKGISFSKGSPILRTAEHIGGSLMLVPLLNGASQVSDHIELTLNDSSLIIEALAFLPPSQKEKESFEIKDQLEKLALLFNNFSSLQGIQYWSGSRKIMRTLYMSAYRVENKKNKKKIQDPASVDELHALLPRQAYLYQKDQTFDGLVTEVQCSLLPTSFVMINTNVTPLALIGVPVLSSDGLRTGFLATPSPDGLLLYFVTSMKAPAVLRNRVFESASNKALALLHWFISEASARDLIAPADLPWNIDDLPAEVRVAKTSK